MSDRAKLLVATGLLREALRLLENSDPPKNGYTRKLIGQIKGFLTKTKI